MKSQTTQDLSGRVPPRANVDVLDMPESEQPEADIIIYICPTPSCNSHYASTEFRPDRTNIRRMQHARSSEDGSVHPTHNRIECPSCRALGIRVQRVPHIVTGVVPLHKMLKALEKANGKEQKSAAV